MEGYQPPNEPETSIEVIPESTPDSILEWLVDYHVELLNDVCTSRWNIEWANKVGFQICQDFSILVREMQIVLQDCPLIGWESEGSDYVILIRYNSPREKFQIDFDLLPVALCMPRFSASSSSFFASR